MFPSKRKIYAGLAGVGIMLGGAGLASAASSSTTSTTTAAVAADTPTTDGTATSADAPPKGDHTPTWTSSVTVPVSTDGTKPTDAELQAVATITADAATSAATASTPGTATKTELRSIAGNVVYEVDVTATAGGDYDVIVDAGNATVLDTHVEGAGHGGRHGDHASEGATTDATATTDAAAAA